MYVVFVYIARDIYGIFNDLLPSGHTALCLLYTGYAGMWYLFPKNRIVATARATCGKRIPF